MMFRNLWRRIMGRKDQSPLRGRRPAGRRPAPWRALTLESLEDRVVPSFSPAVNLPTGAGPLSVVVGDFNADGVPDLATPNFLDGSVSVLLGHGDGSFQAARNTAINGAFSVAVGDFNGDGIQDLAVGTLAEDFLSPGGLSILLGNGDGTFQAPSLVLEGGCSFGDGCGTPNPVVGDLNGDGRLDIVATEFDAFTIGVLLGNGDGTFEFRPVAIPDNPLGAQLGDVNNDGHLDLVAVSPGHTFVDLLLGNGDGSFQPMQRIVAGPLPTTSVALADLNQDGALDIVTATTTTSNQSSVSVLLGRGDGSFQNPVLFPAVDHSVVAPETVVVGDFNGDGIPDVAALITQVQPGSRNVVSVVLGNGDGSLRPPEQTDIDPRVSIADGALVAADLNGDGLTDMVTANFGSDTVSVLFRQAPPANHAPSLAAIADRTVSSSQQVLTVQLSATDPDGDRLTFAATGQSLAFVLNQQAGGLSYHPEFDNVFGAGEKWMLAADGVTWYFLTADGTLS